MAQTLGKLTSLLFALVLLRSTVCHFARDDTRTLDRHRLAIIELELCVLDDECPHLVALTICVQVTLEIALCLDALVQSFGNGSVELREDLHRQDGINVPRLNKLVEGVSELHADTIVAETVVSCVAHYYLPPSLG